MTLQLQKTGQFALHFDEVKPCRIIALHVEQTENRAEVEAELEYISMASNEDKVIRNFDA